MVLIRRFIFGMQSRSSVQNGSSNLRWLLRRWLWKTPASILERVDRDRFGISVGTGIGGLESMERSGHRLVEKGASRISPFAITGMMGNAASANVSQEFGLRGPNICIVTACATGANSVGEAWRAIKFGDADIFLGGGCEATITPFGVAGFAAMKALSLRNDEPEKASRPFDKDRDGFVMGEGGGVLVLEELQHARGRSAPIYCELVGYGCTADAHHMTQPHPEGREVARAMRMAMHHAKVDSRRPRLYQRPCHFDTHR